MRMLLIQYSYLGEWFLLGETEETDIEKAWAEIDDKPTEGAYISFQDDEAGEMLIVNGGFDSE